jgi:hypothetical protein
MPLIVTNVRQVVTADGVYRLWDERNTFPIRETEYAMVKEDKFEVSKTS